MRTIDEVQRRFKEFIKSDDDYFSFEAGALAEFLPEVNPKAASLAETIVLSTMREYMGFAWNKAIDHRGISTSGSVAKMAAWLWILDDEELRAFALDDANYRNYGVPVLRRISEKYSFEIPEEAKSWKDGEPCRQDCDEGCGR